MDRSVQKWGVNPDIMSASASIRGSTVQWDYRTMISGIESSSYYLTSLPLYLYP